SIDDVSVTDVGAFYLGGLTSLTHLQLENTTITDEGLSHLSNLENLQHLTISGHFTPRGLRWLKRLKSLTGVQISSPYVNKADVEAVAAALPALQYTDYYEYSHGPLGPVSGGEKDMFRRAGKQADRVADDALEDQLPPALHLAAWLNAPEEGLTFEQLRGKVVLVDFWGAWCGPCLDELPRLKRLHGRYAEKGLVIVGVHTTRGADEVREFVEKEEIPWAVGVDVEQKTTEGWHIPDYPSYSLVDRSGKLRFARIYRGDLERAVKELLGEE